MAVMTSRARRDGDVRWLTPAESRAWRAYLEVTRRVAERVNRQLVTDSGISSGDYDILVRLSEAPARTLRMSELADRAVNSRSRLTHAVGRMEADGLVERAPCPDDGRGVLCTLTEAGMDVLRAAAPGHVDEVRHMLFDPMSVRDVERFGDLLTAVLAGLQDEARAPEA